MSHQNVFPITESPSSNHSAPAASKILIFSGAIVSSLVDHRTCPISLPFGFYDYSRDPLSRVLVDKCWYFPNLDLIG